MAPSPLSTSALLLMVGDGDVGLLMLVDDMVLNEVLVVLLWMGINKLE